MSEEEDQEKSEWDIESRDWNKMQEHIKLIGFREGAVKGKDLSLQEGFNLGYLDGFKLGELLGTINGIMSCQSGLGLQAKEKSNPDKNYNSFSSGSCILCSEEEASTSSTHTKEFIPRNFDDFLKSQQSHISEIINRIKKPDFEPYFEKG